MDEEIIKADFNTEEEMVAFFYAERNAWMKDILPWHIGVLVAGFILIYFFPYTFSLAWIGFCFCMRYLFVEFETIILRMYCLMRRKNAKYMVRMTAVSHAEGVADLTFIAIICLLVVNLEG